MSRHWHSLTQQEIAEQLQTDVMIGLSERDAKARRARFSSDKIFRAIGMPLWNLLINQFNSYLIVILLVISAYLGLSGAYPQAVMIIIIITARAVLGFIVECLSERLKTVFRQFTAANAKVIRNGRERKIPASELVPGDLVLLEKGALVPADIRLLEADRLIIDELTLTGKSCPVGKAAGPLSDFELPLEDTVNMAYQGTAVTAGSGRGIVIHQTGIFNKAVHKANCKEGTPLQSQLAQMNRTLSVPFLLACLIIVALGTSSSGETSQMLLLGICLAVTAGPWDLPALPNLAQVGGVKRLINCKIFIRKLSSIESLGSTTVLCTGKTGTLTKNEMTVRQVYLGGHILQVSGEGYDPKGTFSRSLDRRSSHFHLFMKAAALCNNALLKRGDIDVTGIFRGIADNRPFRGWSIKGESTEGALLVMAAKAGFWREKIELKEQRLAELPFSSERKRMTVVYRRPAGEMDVYVKGAPEIVLSLCTHTYKNGKASPLSIREREVLLQQIDLMAADSQQVLALAWRALPTGIVDYSDKYLEQELVFLGLAGITDVLRPDTGKAMQSIRRAGIRAVLLTGDHQSTAQSLADKLGIINEKVLTGTDLDHMTEGQLLELVSQVSVYARVSPEQRLRVIQALKKTGQVVATVGSGIDDAPAIKAANIGIAMGITSADVTKEVADIILANERFSDVVTAIKEGKAYYANVRKAIRYLLSGSAGLVLTVLAAALAGQPGLLTPVQILWFGLIAGTLPAIVMGMGYSKHNVMKRTPRHPDYSAISIIAHGLTSHIVTRGLIISLCSLIVFWIGLSLGGEALVSTMVFNTLVFCQLNFIFNCQSVEQAVFEKRLLSSLSLAGAVLISAFLQLLLNYVPLMQLSFDTVHMSRLHWACILVIAAAPAVLVALHRHLTSRAGKKVMFLKV
ncbi:MAG: cation-transporting P-type ATPase [Desulfotomaculaceae bacterium]|nr:cation-transporting P-type ATPase [Desulfotomaculaceae bacterium]